MGDEYTPRYCLQLETAYGNGMMSEGGKEGIEHMFTGISLENKKALDIGSGLGGVAFYLANKYSMHITGLEVNEWMIEESNKRIPPHLKNKVNFTLVENLSSFPKNSDDIIYSKGVLTHLENKDMLFEECHRLLKEEGLFIITDWLSSDEKKWGNHIARLVELENLNLHPESEFGYIELLEKNGFKILSLRDDSSTYLRYNQQVIKRLEDPFQFKKHLNCFSKNELAASVKGYQSIVNALQDGELRVLRFVASKKS